MAYQKIREKNCTKLLSPFFAAPVFRFAPRLSERLEEAIVSVPAGLDRTISLEKKLLI